MKTNIEIAPLPNESDIPSELGYMQPLGVFSDHYRILVFFQDDEFEVETPPTLLEIFSSELKDALEILFSFLQQSNVRFEYMNPRIVSKEFVKDSYYARKFERVDGIMKEVSRQHSSEVLDFYFIHTSSYLPAVLINIPF